MKKRGVINLFFIFVILFSLFSISFSFISASQLRVTLEHPFLVDGSWISANQLVVGDLLTTIDGKYVRITNITDVISKNNFSVYNLEAKQYSNFVVGTEKVVVHNSHAPILENVPKENMVLVRHYFDPEAPYRPDPSLTMAQGLERDLYLYGSKKMFLRRVFLDDVIAALSGVESTSSVRYIYVTTKGIRTPITLQDLRNLMGGIRGNRVGYIEFEIPTSLYNSFKVQPLLNPTDYWNAFKLYGWQHSSIRIPVIGPGMPITKNSIKYITQLQPSSIGSQLDFAIAMGQVGGLVGGAMILTFYPVEPDQEILITSTKSEDQIQNPNPNPNPQQP